MSQTDYQNAAANPFLLQTAASWLAEGHQLALAFVMQSWGSSPRPAGSIMLVRSDMRVEGSVSGGCVEGAVIEAALEAMESGAGQRLDFGVADAKAWEVGLSCGGRIAVLVTPVGGNGLAGDLLEKTARQLAARQPVRLSFAAESGAVVAAPQGSEASALDEAAGRFDFVQLPLPRLVIVGGVHISQHLAPMAARSGFQTEVIDPRSLFTNPDRFVQIAVETGWPQDILADRPPDAETAVVTLSHDPKIDDPALLAALNSPAFYIACLGSRKTHAARRERLGEAGIAPDQLDRLHGPAGLNIGARSPAEIAVSVLAELIQAYRSRAG